MPAAASQCHYTPVWLMRQAGRYMSEYREVRATYSFLETVQDSPSSPPRSRSTPPHRLNVDAAIIFADILLIVEPMGLDLEFAKGEGPVIHNPVRTARTSNASARSRTSYALDYVFEAIRITRRELRPDIPLIGFCGAPFTLASYIFEGGGSKNYVHTKRLMYTDAGAWHALMSKIARALSQLSQRADRGGRAGRPALRLVGRRALARRLPRVRPAAHARGHPGRDAGRPRHPLRHGHGRRFWS